MSDTNSEEKHAAAKKLESSTEHAKKALDAASEAGKAVGETVKKQAQTAYDAGREHLTAAAKDLGDAASVKYKEIRGKAQTVTEDYKGRAKSALDEATAKAQNFQGATSATNLSRPLASLSAWASSSA